MRSTISMLMLAGALLVTPLIAAAAVSGDQAKASKPAAEHATTSHAVTGTVKSFDAKTLVITKNGKNAGDMTFDVSTSTQREGDVAAGVPVSVRYHDAANHHVATAIAVQHKGHETSQQKGAAKQ